MSWAPERERSPSGPLNICHGCGQVNTLEARLCRRCHAEVGRRHDVSAPRKVPVPRVPEPPGPPVPPLPSLPSLPHARRLAPARVASPVVLLAAAAGLATLLSLGTGSTRSRPRAASKAAIPIPGVVQPSAPRPPAPVRRAPAPAPAPGPLATVQAYWRSIDRHAFTAAYGHLEPDAAPMSVAQFDAYERSIGVRSAAFSGEVTARSADSATVAVRTLITRDGRFGCQSWSGGYELARSSGRWRIARAAIASRPCGG